MKLAELVKLPECPEWLKSPLIRVEDEDIVIENGVVIWKAGIWKAGIWKGGIWEDGVWKYGVWKDGAWERGVWERGIWKYGTWERGIWKAGIWKAGTWERGTWKDGAWERGIWEDGVWKGGTWEDGIWKGGTWERGIWKGGWRVLGQCQHTVRFSMSEVSIGCEIKTFAEWDEWFASDEEYETKRGTEQFELIFKAYKIARASAQIYGYID